MMDVHGTKLMELKPSSILAAAEKDLQRRVDNLQLCKVSVDNSGYPFQFQRFAFLAPHVRAAKSAADLLRRALRDAEDGGRGILSHKRMTRLIYGQPDLLRAALELANS